MTEPPSLARRLGTRDATVIGLASMLGAGVFAAFTPAAQAAGAGLLIGLVVAAIVALGNALSTAQLAASYPTSGGAYAYGRERLGAWPGFIAGWSFVLGKTASCAAMAITFGAYAAPPGWERPFAVLAIVLLVGVNLLGITRTAAASRVILVIVLLALAVVIAAGSTTGLPALAEPLDLVAGGPYGILQSAGLLFFAFAGYARIATLGEEVRDPGRSIPIAVLLALSIAVVLYGVIAVVSIGSLGSAGLAASSEPLTDVARVAGWDWAVPVVRIGAAAASLGALLALVAGVGRTTFAMARNGDLPRWLATVHPRSRVPHRAELAVGIAACVLIAVVDLRTAVAFSSFGVLVYYLVANASAFTQPAEQRLFPRSLSVIGAIGCLVLAFTLPSQSVVVGVLVIAVGVAGRAIVARSASRKAPNEP